MSTGKQLSHIMETPLGCDWTTHNHKNISQTAVQKLGLQEPKSKRIPPCKDLISWTPQTEDAQAWPQSIMNVYAEGRALWPAAHRSRWLGTDRRPSVPPVRELASGMQRTCILSLCCLSLCTLPFLCVVCYPVGIPDWFVWEGSTQ